MLSYSCFDWSTEFMRTESHIIRAKWWSFECAQEILNGPVQQKPNSVLKRWPSTLFCQFTPLISIVGVTWMASFWVETHRNRPPGLVMSTGQCAGWRTLCLLSFFKIYVTRCLKRINWITLLQNPLAVESNQEALRWVSTRKTQLQCVSNSVTSFLH